MSEKLLCRLTLHRWHYFDQWPGYRQCLWCFTEQWRYRRNGRRIWLNEAP